MTAFDTLIENWHGFISWSNLNLHKVSLRMIAVRTILFCSINIFPSSGTSKDIIDPLSGWKGLFCHPGFDWTRIWTSHAKEMSVRSVVIRSCRRMSDLQQRSVQRAEPHLAFVPFLSIRESISLTSFQKERTYFKKRLFLQISCLFCIRSVRSTSFGTFVFVFSMKKIEWKMNIDGRRTDEKVNSMLEGMIHLKINLVKSIPILC